MSTIREIYKCETNGCAFETDALLDVNRHLDKSADHEIGRRFKAFAQIYICASRDFKTATVALAEEHAEKYGDGHEMNLEDSLAQGGESVAAEKAEAVETPAAVAWNDADLADETARKIAAEKVKAQEGGK